MNNATKTANGKYCYNNVYYGKTLDAWVNECHKANCAKNGWRFQPLRRGAFGYDNIVVSLVYLFRSIETNKGDKDVLCDAVHQGWCENYQYWRDNQPWKTDVAYSAPLKPLGDAQRDMCLTTSYVNLPKDEQDKDLLFVDYVLSILSS
jgi:hypothetical protein